MRLSVRDRFTKTLSNGFTFLAGGFKGFLFSPLPGEIIQFVWYCSIGLKPPPSFRFLKLFVLAEIGEFLSNFYQGEAMGALSGFHQDQMVDVYDHQTFQVPKMEVLTYISCMDTAYVRESPAPKTAWNKVLGDMIVCWGLPKPWFTVGVFITFHRTPSPTRCSSV